MMILLALSQEQIDNLPDNYNKTVLTARQAVHDEESRDALPPDLFDPRGDWLQIAYKSPGFAHRIATAHEEAYHVGGRRISRHVGSLLPGDIHITIWRSPQDQSRERCVCFRRRFSTPQCAAN